MEVRFWTDFVCPYCYGAEHLFLEVLKELGKEDAVRLIPMSFELDPALAKDLRQGLLEYWAMEQHSSIDTIRSQYQESMDFLTQAGLHADLDLMKVTNTHDAHKVYHYAEEEGVGLEYFIQAQKAHFSEGVYLSDHEVLLGIAQSVGLNGQNVRKVLELDEYSQKVKLEHEAGIAKNIQYVPHFVFPSGRSIEGVLGAGEIRHAILQELDV